MKPYADPYVAGAGIGAVLLAAYALAGQGLGASGGFASVAAALTAAAVGPARAASSPALAAYLSNGVLSPLGDWVVWELAGVALGAFVSAWRAGRLTSTVERGDGVAAPARLVSAV